MDRFDYLFICFYLDALMICRVAHCKLPAIVESLDGDRYIQ